VEGHPRSAVWSPDGGSIRFTLDLGEFGTQTIWEMTAEGKGLHSILSKNEHPSRQSAGNWTEDGKYFLFSGCEGSDCNLWGIRNAWSWFRRSHHEPFPLTSGPDWLHVTIPAQMGSRIFAFSFHSHRDLEKIGPHAQRTSTLNLDSTIAEASFSPNDEMVVYLNRQDDSLWRSRINGEARIPLTLTPLHGRYARWSPDGKHILFTGARQNQPRNVYVISPDGGSLHPVLPSGWEASEADWSPDGYRIVVAMRNQKTYSKDGIYTLEPTTGTLKEILGSDGLTEPRWSPDGRYIAAEDEAKHKLFSYEVEKSKWSLLASGGLIESLYWARDSSAVYFQDQIEAQEPIYRGNVTSRKVERVLGFGDLLRGSATHCFFTGVGGDGSIYVMIERGLTEIYSLDLDLP
jgi:Tol biopolymer transport system component